MTAVPEMEVVRNYSGMTEKEILKMTRKFQLLEAEGDAVYMYSWGPWRLKEDNMKKMKRKNDRLSDAFFRAANCICEIYREKTPISEYGGLLKRFLEKLIKADYLDGGFYKRPYTKRQRIGELRKVNENSGDLEEPKGSAMPRRKFKQFERPLFNVSSIMGAMKYARDAEEMAFFRSGLRVVLTSLINHSIDEGWTDAKELNNYETGSPPERWDGPVPELYLEVISELKPGLEPGEDYLLVINDRGKAMDDMFCTTLKLGQEGREKSTVYRKEGHEKKNPGAYAFMIDGKGEVFYVDKCGHGMKEYLGFSRYGYLPAYEEVSFPVEKIHDRKYGRCMVKISDLEVIE